MSLSLGFNAAVLAPKLEILQFALFYEFERIVNLKMSRWSKIGNTYCETGM